MSADRVSGRLRAAFSRKPRTNSDGYQAASSTTMSKSCCAQLSAMVNLQ